MCVTNNDNKVKLDGDINLNTIFVSVLIKTGERRQQQNRTMCFHLFEAIYIRCLDMGKKS